MSATILDFKPMRPDSRSFVGVSTVKDANTTSRDSAIPFLEEPLREDVLRELVAFALEWSGRERWPL